MPRVPPELQEAFVLHFGSRAAAAARAPGRVNLIGEHTDYCEGLVLPCAIDRDTRVLAAGGRPGRLRVVSRQLEAREEVALPPQRRGDWVDYVQAPLFALAERGLPVPGVDLLVDSEVPRESGLSSSAALGVGVVTALDALLGLGLEATERARLAHRGENAFVGVGCGIMDPFASALGQRDRALRIDCRSQAVSPVPLGSELRLLIVRSGVRRALAHGGYDERVAQCRAALDQARAAGLGPATALRDFGPGDLPALARALEPLPLRRARHVVTENQRVDDFVRALAAGDLEAAGALLRAGQASLRDDFEVSVPELDRLCALGDEQPGCYGSRLTGAGFGGCTLHLVAPDAASAVASAVAEGFAASFGRRPEFLTVRAADGAAPLAVAA